MSLDKRWQATVTVEVMAEDEATARELAAVKITARAGTAYLERLTDWSPFLAGVIIGVMLGALSLNILLTSNGVFK